MREQKPNRRKQFLRRQSDDQHDPFCGFLLRSWLLHRHQHLMDASK